jgi:hypothetical protein
MCLVEVELYVLTAILMSKSCRYPLNRTLGGPYSRHGRCEEEKSFALTEKLNFGSVAVNPLSSHYTDRDSPVVVVRV